MLSIEETKGYKMSNRVSSINIEFLEVPCLKGFESTEPYTGCGIVYFYFNRASNVSASVCDDNIKYGVGMSELPKWQHYFMEKAIEIGVPFMELLSLYNEIERESDDSVPYSKRLSKEELMELTVNKIKDIKMLSIEETKVLNWNYNIKVNSVKLDSRYTLTIDCFEDMKIVVDGRNNVVDYDGLKYCLREEVLSLAKTIRILLELKK